MATKKESMTIHKGLSELKLSDSKIDKLIDNISPTGIYQKGKQIGGFYSEVDFEKSAKEKYQSITDLMTRKTKIKAAIVKANAKTFVTIGGRKMTIADAINERASLGMKTKLATKLRQSLSQSLSSANIANEKVQENLKGILEVSLGKDNVKVNTDDAAALTKMFLDSNTVHIADPIGVQKKIEALETEVMEFESEIDSALSEINATTTIEI